MKWMNGIKKVCWVWERLTMLDKNWREAIIVHVWSAVNRKKQLLQNLIELVQVILEKETEMTCSLKTWNLTFGEDTIENVLQFKCINFTIGSGEVNERLFSCVWGIFVLFSLSSIDNIFLEVDNILLLNLQQGTHTDYWVHHPLYEWRRM